MQKRRQQNSGPRRTPDLLLKFPLVMMGEEENLFYSAGSFSSMIPRINAGIVFLCILLTLPGAVNAVLSDQNTTITLERGMCFGTCPVYTLTVSGNGTVIYDGQMYVPEIGVRHGTMNVTSFSLLMDQFESAGFFNLNDTYTRYSITDMPSATITIQNIHQTKRVEHYHGDLTAPKVLIDLEDAVDQAVNVTQWTTPYNPGNTGGEVI